MKIEKPDFVAVAQRLKEYSQNLKDNNQIGNSKIVLAFSEMIAVMAWESVQRDTNNIQVANLIGEIKNLRQTIDQANANSSNLEQANYRLQVIMVLLTGVGTFVVAVPILKVMFTWLAAHLPIIQPVTVSSDAITLLSAAVAGVLVAILGALLDVQIWKKFIVKEK